MHKGVHWPDRLHLGAPGERAQEGICVGQSSLSAVVEHAMEQMHDIGWMGATVVDGHPHFHQRCALEAWHIRSQDSTMNRDAAPLPSVYNPLINRPNPS